MAKWIAALFSLIALSSFAQTRFDGTWRMRMDTLQFSGTPEEYLITHDMYHCLSCVTEYTTKSSAMRLTTTRSRFVFWTAKPSISLSREMAD